jgi:hypothetical protein
VGQGVDGDVQGQLLTVIRADAFAIVTGVVGAERAAKAVFAHDRDKVALMEQPFQLDIPRLVQATNPFDVIE